MASFTKRNLLSDLFLYPSDQTAIKTNPPYFTWPQQPDALPVKFELKNKANKIIHKETTQSNLIELVNTLKPGAYNWSLTGSNLKKQTFHFSVPENAAIFQAIKVDELIAKIPNQHPKHLWDDKYKKLLLVENGTNLKLLKANLKQAILDGIPPQPVYYKITDDSLRAKEMTIYFKRFRQFCDRNMIASAFAWYLWKKPEAKKIIEDFFHTVLNWNTEGVCAVDGPWGDEIGLSLSRCLAIAFDLTHDIWSEAETLWIKKTLHLYAKQTYRRLINTQFMQKPGNSHVGRLPAYLGDFAIVLNGFAPADEIKAWLSYSLKALNTFYPFYGEDDGAWSQGSFYASTYLKWHLPFFLLVEKMIGRSFFDKPFHKNYIHYLSHFLNPKNEIHPFGDGFWSYDIRQEWPGFFADNPMKIYQEKFGNSQTKIIANLAPKRKLIELHLFDEMVPTKAIKRSKQAVKQLSNDHCFSETGLISTHSDLLNHKQDNAIYIRCSKFGAGSHQHADQGNFAILSKGKALLSPSGFFGHHYGDTHHSEWTQTTQAHNLYLINQTGQPYGSANTTGEIQYFESNQKYCATSLDLSQAYPMSHIAKRHFVFVKPGYLLLIDHIELNKSSQLQWLLHSLVKPKISIHDIEVKRDNSQIKGVFLNATPNNCKLTNQFNWQSKFSNEKEGEKRTQYHTMWNFHSATTHHIAMLFSINGAKENYQINAKTIHFPEQKLTFSLENGANIH